MSEELAERAGVLQPRAAISSAWQSPERGIAANYPGSGITVGGASDEGRPAAEGFGRQNEGVEEGGSAWGGCVECGGARAERKPGIGFRSVIPTLCQDRP